MPLRRVFVFGTVVLMASGGCTDMRSVSRSAPLESHRPPLVVDATIVDLREALDAGRLTSRQIVAQYLARIDRYEDLLNAAISVNPRALEEADGLDRERRAGRLRGPLHGIPIALKDNIHADGMPTTGGALVFASLRPPYEATVTRHLRDAGAIIFAKTTLTELANWVAGGPTPMPAGYNSLTGFSLNPYDPRSAPRPGIAEMRPVLSPGGSSSGAGTAASLWPANVGTETSGSILNPANQTMLVAIKPTVGRISRYGVIPITADQDTPGPMARSVADAAILLGVLEGTSPDPQDAATRACAPPPSGDYEPFLRRNALDGARIGIPRAFFYDRLNVPGVLRGGLTVPQAEVMTRAIAALRAEGAVIVDPADVPSVVAANRAGNALAWFPCADADEGRDHDAECSSVLKYGMKRDFNAWLATLQGRSPVISLTALREWNRAHVRDGALKYGQSALDISDEIDLDRDRRRYETDRARDVALGGAEGIDAALRVHRLDALLFPGSDGSWLAAKAGYPSVIVPFSTVPGSPDSGPLPGETVPPVAPFGVSFTASACSEPRLIELAYAFEQATRRRVPPPYVP